MPTSPPKAELHPLDKRVVLLHCTGRWKGIYQILGTQSETVAESDLTALPAFLPECEMGDGRIAAVSMVRVEPRWLLYKEATPPGGKNAEFHPSQT